MDVSATAPQFDGTTNTFSSPDRDEAKVMKQFESVMLSMVLKQMRQSSSEEGLFPGDKGDTLGGMFDSYMGDHLAESGGFGLMESFEGNMNPGVLNANPSQAIQQIREHAIGAYTDALSNIAE